MYDVVVVGAGLAGLTAGAKLAKEGRRVCVLEKHSRPGGCATNYRRKHFDVDVSLHILDGFDGLDPKRPILEDLGVFSRLEWVNVPGPFYRVLRGEEVFELPFGIEAAADALDRRQPGEGHRVRRLLRRMNGVRTELSSFPYSPREVMKRIPIFPFLYPRLSFSLGGTLGDTLDRSLQDEEAKLALVANLPFIHDDPYTVSAKFFGVAQAAFLEAGAVYIKGGSQQLSNQLQHTIEAAGGEVRLRHRVTRLVTRGGRVTAVEFEHRKERGQVEAREVIANAAIPHVLHHLLDEGSDPRLSRLVKKFRVGPSLMAFHAGLSRPLQELGSRHYLSFDIPRSVRGIRDMGPNADGPPSERIMNVTDYGQIDSGLAPPGKSLVAACMLDRMAPWEGLDASAYRDRKAELEDMFLDRLEGLYPGFRQAVEFVELATPRTVRRYTNNTEGSFAGFEQNPSQALMRRFFRVRSGLRNLHFAGAWQFPGGGYTCALLSGYLAAQTLIEGRLRHPAQIGFGASKPYSLSS
ncbi:MAG: NAD(P)/FAD-dependent oxidoreductase [Myxococcota bacterium]